MTNLIKLSLAKKLLQALNTTAEVNIIPTILKNLRLSKKSDDHFFYFMIPRATLPYGSEMNSSSGIQIQNDNFILPTDKNELISTLLTFNDEYSAYKIHNTSPIKVLVEFSSPNVAKPFHVGHFRSTVLGNFVAHISNYFAKDVVRINYLGDWGTQFGLLQIGIDKMNVNKIDFHNNPLQVLYKAYCKANELLKSNPDIQTQASNIFQHLEFSNDESDWQDWKDFRKITVEELRTTYQRLGISFNVYNWESDYAAQKIVPVLDRLKNMKKAVQIDGAWFLLEKDRKITFLKSNGSTLYLTRDVAAAIDRYEKYKFDKMIYVTDQSQENHFRDLKTILKELDHSWFDSIEHVKYGKISGMSSREGKGVFLKDLLDEARDRMFEKQRNTRTTKVSLEDTKVSDLLGMSALITYILKMRRLKGIKFNWDECLQLNGDGGVKLQYTHCRLVSLESECGKELPVSCDPSLLQESIAIELIFKIAQFEDVLCLAHDEMESSVVVVFLFQLANTINKALKNLNVKHAEHDIARQRLLLFRKARLVLKEGMIILGLIPLNKM